MCDKERIENSKIVTKRSQLLLAELSTAMDPQEWLLAQAAVPASYPKTGVSARTNIRKDLPQIFRLLAIHHRRAVLIERSIRGFWQRAGKSAQQVFRLS